MKIALLSLLALAVHPLAAASLLSDLSRAQAAQVLRGEQVVTMQEIEGKPWPRVKLYQKIQATPEEVAAVFFDYQHAKGYIPHLLKSEISRIHSPCVLEVDYEVDVPVLADEAYTAKNSLSADPDGSYCVTWNLVRALQTKASEGNLRIEPIPGGSVIRYTNLVTPGSAMAGLLRKIAIQQMRDTVHAIVRQVESQKRDHPKALEQEIEDLRSALGEDGKKPSD
jgi:hypothetical protein